MPVPLSTLWRAFPPLDFFPLRSAVSLAAFVALGFFPSWSAVSLAAFVALGFFPSWPAVSLVASIPVTARWTISTRVGIASSSPSTVSKSCQPRFPRFRSSLVVGFTGTWMRFALFQHGIVQGPAQGVCGNDSCSEESFMALASPSFLQSSALVTLPTALLQDG